MNSSDLPVNKGNMYAWKVKTAGDEIVADRVRMTFEE